jgi:hypothetical protein
MAEITTYCGGNTIMVVVMIEEAYAEHFTTLQVLQVNCGKGRRGRGREEVSEHLLPPPVGRGSEEEETLLVVDLV